MLDGLSLRDLWQPIAEGLERHDVEAHLVALILRSQRTSGVACDPQFVSLRDSFDPACASDASNAQHVATIGLRLALGFPIAVPPLFSESLKREVAREPLPPAACLRDDERLLLGVSAGIGVVDRSQAETIRNLARGRERQTGFRQGVVDLWAESLAFGSTLLNEDTARRATAKLSTIGDLNPIDADDSPVAFWLAGALLNAAWTPSDEQIATIERVRRLARTRVMTSVARGEMRSSIDAAFAFEGFVESPADTFARRSALESVFAVIDAFPASAGVLRNRQRGRPSFELTDEYDVQDLFHTMILPAVTDIVPEDPAPKVAGRSSRLDFVSRKTRLGFELKHLKSAADRERVREEILLDERVYQAHPYIDTVVVFVSDPSTFLPLAARAAFESDLSQSVVVGGRTINYLVRVR